MSERINSHSDLRVYQEACDLDFAVFELSQGFPPEEQAALSAPARRAARGIGAAIADAWAKRKDVPRKVEALTSADGELQATRHWVGRAQACGYLDQGRHRELEQRCDAIGRMLGTMIRDAGKFGGNRPAEGDAAPSDFPPSRSATVSRPPPPPSRPSPRQYPPRNARPDA
jgi:four helix bundle protein